MKNIMLGPAAACSPAPFSMSYGQFTSFYGSTFKKLIRFTNVVMIIFVKWSIFLEQKLDSQSLLWKICKIFYNFKP